MIEPWSGSANGARRRPLASLVEMLSEAQAPDGIGNARAVPIPHSRISEPAMTSVMPHWNSYRIWLLSRYPVWLAYGGLTAAMALAFAIVSH